MTKHVVENILFPAIEPYRSGTLVVDELHTLYWEECGNPEGLPVLFLHGGPGSGLSPQHRRFFNSAHYRIVLFDQRGAGKSTPLGEYRNNTTQLLIGDIERIRLMLDIEKWLVFGGSWGSTLALAYGESHPESCLGFILRGIFLCTQAEIDWFMHGMKWFYPEAHEKLSEGIPQTEQGDLLKVYQTRLFCDDPAVYLPAARLWSIYEGSCLYLQPDPDAISTFGSDEVSLGVGRLEAHYFLHQGFLQPDELIHGLSRIRHLPATIIQGRYDIVCPPATAYRLHKAWPEARFSIINDAGHAAYEPGIATALVAATEQFRLKREFT